MVVSADIGVGKLRHDAAAAFLRDKLRLPTERYDDIVKEQHARAFVIAGATRDAFLADMQAALVKARKDGMTREQWRKVFEEQVTKHGWTGWTGERSEAGRAWRANVIYDTNMRTAFMAGRYKQLTEPAFRQYRPWWRYRHADFVQHPRKQHVEWDKKPVVLRWDDPWWLTHFPPNDWGCHCYVEALSDRDLQKLGIKVTDAPPSPIDPKTGAPSGIGKGWDYNVGRAAWGEQQAEATIAKGPFVELPGRRPADYPALPENVPAKPAPAPPVNYATLEIAASNLPKGIYTDPTGERINVTDALIEHWRQKPARFDGRQNYLPLLPDLLTNPSEIWYGFIRYANGKMAIRRRYVSVYTTDAGERYVGAVADTVDGQLIDIELLSTEPRYELLTMLRGRDTTADDIRKGWLAWPWPQT